MDIFENLENLNVSEECLEDILSIVENILDENEFFEKTKQLVNVAKAIKGNPGSTWSKVATMGQAMDELNRKKDGSHTISSKIGSAINKFGRKMGSKPRSTEQLKKDYERTKNSRDNFKKEHPNLHKHGDYTDNLENAWSKMVRNATKKQYLNTLKKGNNYQPIGLSALKESTFNDIILMVEALLSEDVYSAIEKYAKPNKKDDLIQKAGQNQEQVQNKTNLIKKPTKLQKGALKTDRHRGVASKYMYAITNGEGNQLDPSIKLRNE